MPVPEVPGAKQDLPSGWGSWPAGSPRTNQWTQFEEFPQFMEGVEKITQLGGDMTHWRISIGRVHREFDAKIPGQHPDERVAWSSADGTNHSGVVAFHRLDADNTRVTLQMITAPEGFVETLGDKLGLVKAPAEGDMKRFKSFIESRGAETGAFRGDIR